MPLQVPQLDDRNFEQLLDEAKRRIPIHTPEWTNFQGESDPGITIVELFAFLTESLLYRANRIPERNRLRFLQLLDIPLRPAAAAEGLVVIRPDRGATGVTDLDAGVVVAAGKVNFLTRDGVAVLPLEAQAYYKQPVPRTTALDEQFEAVLKAMESAEEDAGEESGDDQGAGAEDDAGGSAGAVATATATAQDAQLAYYQTLPVPLPTPSNPNPSLDLNSQCLDGALYLALLAPKNVDPADVRQAIGGHTLSVGIAPALATTAVAPLMPLDRRPGRRPVTAALALEIPENSATPEHGAKWSRPEVVKPADALTDVGVLQVRLPQKPEQLQTWPFSEPLQEGSGDFPPRLEDEAVKKRLVTWVRLRLETPSPQTAPAVATAAGAAATSAGAGPAPEARISWVGINAARITQAVPVTNESLGAATGEPDQTVTLANTPILTASVRLQVRDDDGKWETWRLVDDLLTAGPDDPSFSLDRESGVVRFGGLYGRRPGPGQRIRASYEYGGGPQGNLGIGTIKSSPDPRLQGGFKIENPLPTWGGTAGETLAEGERNIPLYIRHRDRLVTQKDFEDIARRAEGVDVARAEVLPLYRPPTVELQNPPSPAPGVVTVLVIPRTDATRPLWPTPDRLFLRKVCAHLDPRRLVTTELHVRGPDYQPVFLSVGIQVQAGHFRDVVIDRVGQALRQYLSSIPPGGPGGNGWPLNKKLLKKELEAAVDRTEGVDFVENMLMGVRDATDQTEYPLTNLQLPLVARLTVVEGQPVPLAEIVGAAAGVTVKTVAVPVFRSKC
jgi:hypothetical protein